MRFLDNSDKDSLQPQPGAHLHAMRASREAGPDPEYRMQAGRGFDALKHALTLLTGTLLLDLVKAERTVADRALTEKAAESVAEARAAILSCKPRDEVARHHLHHLRRALEQVDEITGWAGRQADLIQSDRSAAFSDAIRAAWDELKKLDGLMQGFQMIDLGQSCCAYHDRLIRQIAQN